jgi:Activator of Hsp90 ATPase, N-terminal
VNYSYELSLKFKGEWKIKDEDKKVKGHLDIPEFSFGELDDLQVLKMVLFLPLLLSSCLGQMYQELFLNVAD